MTISRYNLLNSITQYRKPLIATAIMLLALVLRVHQLQTTRIVGDQSFTLNLAMQWINTGELPLAANKSSVGFLNPPMIEYLYGAALLLWADIVVVNWLTLLSGMVAIGVTGWVVCRVFGRWAAFWALLLFSVNPWMVYYSQLIWNQTMLPVFAVLTFAGLVLYFAVEQNPRYLVGSIVAAACMTQVHLGSVMQLGTMGVVGLIFFTKLKWRPLFVGGCLFLLTYAPYLWLQYGLGWADIRAMVSSAGESAQLTNAAVLVSLDLLRGQGLFANNAHVVPFDRLAVVLQYISWLVNLGLLIYFGRLRSSDPVADRRFSFLLITFLWWLLPILYYTRSATYLQTYYLMGQIPAQFVLLAIAIAFLQGRLGRDDRFRPNQSQLRPALVAIVPLIWIGWQIGFGWQFQQARAVNAGGETQVRHVRSVINMANRLLAEYPTCRLVVVSQGHQQESSQLSVMREFTDRDRIILVDGHLAIAMPQGCALYLDARPGSRGSNWVRENAALIDGTQLSVLGESWAFYLREDSDAGEASISAEWVNGAALTQFKRGAISAGQPLSVELHWQLTDVPTVERYHIGTYVLTNDNQVVAQSDGPGFDSIQWRSGDRFITWFDVILPPELPDEPLRLAVAFYSWPDVVRTNLVTGDNTAYLETIE